jgi:peptidoglycan hydrolase-like protein with peptidoglycan-binding domain
MPILINQVPTIPTNNTEGCTNTTLFSPLTGGKCPTVTIPPTNIQVPTVTPPTVTPPTITRVLKQGMEGNDVKELQKYLNTHNYPVSLTGLGSLNNETTYFGLKTKQAVILFQKANGLVGDGVVGKMTRERMK